MVKFSLFQVNVGINDRFLTIVESNSGTLLVHPLEELTWQLEGLQPDQMPYLIVNLSFEEEIKNGNSTTIDISNETTQFLMITGNQTFLIDALLKTMTGRRLDRSSSDVSLFFSSNLHSNLIISEQLVIRLKYQLNQTFKNYRVKT